MNNLRLLTVEDAFNSTQEETNDMYKKYMNPGLVKLLKLLKFDKKFIKAEDFSIWDSEGTKYIDFLGGYGAMNFGHNNQKIKKAIETFLAEDFPNILQISLNPLASVLSYNLALLCPGNLEKVFYCNSGAEAVEGALKIARKATKRKQIIYCNGSFHGKTFGALSVTGRKKYQTPFEPLVPQCISVPYGEIEPLKNILQKRKTAAFIVEPIQGEGGMNVPPEGYLKGAEDLCHKYGTLFIVDEIQTGMGRTGNNFACEYENINPDIMTLAKSLGGGIMPIGAYISSSRVWHDAYGDLTGQDALLHTSTFGGNSLACLSAIKAIEVLREEELADKARQSGEYLLEKLKVIQSKHPKKIKEVRGRGLMIGIEFKESRIPGIKNIQHEYMAAIIAGILFNDYKIITAYTLNNPNVIRLEPPLTINKNEIDILIDAIDKICLKGGFLKDTISLFS